MGGTVARRPINFLICLLVIFSFSCGKEEKTNTGKLSIHLILPMRHPQPNTPEFEAARLTQIERYRFHFYGVNQEEKVVDVIRRDFLPGGYTFSDISYNSELRIMVEALNFMGVILARGEQTVNYQDGMEQSIQI